VKEYRCRRCEYRFCSENGIPYCPACDYESLELLEENHSQIKEDIILEEHHIHPRFMDNGKGKGEKFKITKKQHCIVHGIIMNCIWDCVKEEDKKDAIEYIIRESKKFLGVK